MAQSFVPFGPSFIVNSDTTGDQTVPTIAALENGSSAVVYQSADLSGSGDGTVIRLALLNADGASTGSDILVSTASADNDVFPSIKALPDGNFVATWIDSTTSTLYARIYSDNLTPLTGQFQVDQNALPYYNPTSSPAYIPVIQSTVSSGSGPFLELWTAQNGSGTDVYGRLFNENGTPAGNEFEVNTVTAGSQLRPRASLLGDGNILVDYIEQNGSNYSVNGVVLNPTTGAVVTSDFQINVTSAGTDATRESSQLLGNGDTLVAWESGEGGSTNTRIRYRLLDSNGNPIGTTDTLLNAQAAGTGNQRAPVVRTLSGGGVVVTYENLTSTGFTIDAAVFDSNGNLTTPSQTLLTVNVPQTSPVDYDFRSIGNNQFLLTWNSQAPGGATGGSGDGNGNGIQGDIFVLTNSGDFLQYASAAGQTLTGTSSTANYLHAFDGGSGGDTLVGGAGANYLFGGIGNDTLVAGAGQNFMYGGGGDNTFVIGPNANLTNAVIEGGGYVGAQLAAGAINTLQIALGTTTATLDFRTATIDNINAIQCTSTSANNVLDFDVSQFHNLLSVTKSTATVTVNLYDTASDNAGINLSQTSFSGFTSSDLIVANASATTAPITISGPAFADGVYTELLGGSGNDTFNLADGGINDVVIGGSGSNTAVFSGDRAGYAITHSTAAGVFAPVLTTTVTDTATGGVDTLTGVQTLQFADVTIPSYSPADNFTGGGVSDILGWNPTTGVVGDFVMNNGVAGAFQDIAWINPSSGYSLAGAGDFYGTGTADILLANSSGQIGEFQMDNNVATWQGLGLINSGAGWAVAGTGDFYGSGTDDILLANQSAGQIGEFEMNNGVAIWQGIGTVNAASGWAVAGTGDFFGNGTGDILLANQSAGQIGMFEINKGVASWQGIGTVDASAGWAVAGTGDFFGNGTDDILLANSQTGALGMFAMHNGTATWQSIGTVGAGWQVAGTGDYFGNGTSDILLQNASTGGIGMFAMNNGVASWQGISSLPAGWHVS
jgi:hypothetical protein